MLGAALALGALALAPAAATAEGPAKLWKKGQNCGDISKLVAGECSGAEESEAGERLVETSIPRGVAADPECPATSSWPTSSNAGWSS